MSKSKAMTRKDFENFLKERDKIRFEKTNKTLKSISLVVNSIWVIGYGVAFWLMALIGFMGAVLYFARELHLVYTAIIFMKIVIFTWAFSFAVYIYACVVDRLIKKREKEWQTR